MSAVDPYTQLAVLAERELALAREGRVGELAELAERWQQLTAALPAHPPASARAALQRAAVLTEHINAELLSRRARMLGAQRQATRAGRTAAGYARSARRALARVDHSA